MQGEFLQVHAEEGVKSETAYAATLNVARMAASCVH